MWRGLLYRAAGALVMVDNVSVAIVLGQTLALVEESGCGQATTGKAVVQLLRAPAVVTSEARFPGEPFRARRRGLARRALPRADRFSEFVRIAELAQARNGSATAFVKAIGCKSTPLTRWLDWRGAGGSLPQPARAGCSPEAPSVCWVEPKHPLKGEASSITCWVFQRGPPMDRFGRGHAAA